MANHISLIFDNIPNLFGGADFFETRFPDFKQKSNNKGIDELAEYLNSVFYPDSNSNGEAILSAINKQAVNLINQNFNRVSLTGNRMFADLPVPSGKIAINDLDMDLNTSHSKAIRVKTIQQRNEWSKMLLEQIPDNIEEYKVQRSKLETIYNTTIQLLNNITAQKGVVVNRGIAIAKGKGSNTTRQLINDMDNAFASIIYITSMAIPPDQSGEIFERALQTLGQGAAVITAENADKLVKEAFAKSTPGAALVNRGGLINLQGVEVIEQKDYTNWQGNLDHSYVIQGEGGSQVKITGAFQEAQGKIDIEFKMPNIGDSFDKKFRVSAKNWNSLKNRDFGNTRLSYAILRSAGLNDMYTYAFAISYPKASGYSQQAHKFAKACLLLDILMGYSQKTGYADTIIINDRSAQEIKVYSIYEIINRILNNLEKADGVFEGYNPGAIVGSLSSLNYSGKLSEQNYMKVIYNALSKFKIQITSKALTL